MSHYPPGGMLPESPLAPAAPRHATPAGDEQAGAEIDPLAIALAEPASGIAFGPPEVGRGGLPSIGVPSHAALEGARPAWESLVVEEIVRRVAWGGDRRRGVARIELGGAHAGTHIIVEGDGREVAVEIALAPGTDLGELPARVAARLARRGLTLRSFEVR